MALLFSLATVLAGCLSASPGVPDSSVQNTERPVVVALIDSGINPYHIVFSAGDASAGLQAFGSGLRDTHTDLPPREIALTFLEDFDAALDADAATWEALEPRTLVSFPGTRVLGISFYSREDNLYSVLDSGIGHGTGTSSVLLDSAPSVLLVMVEVSGSTCYPYTDPCVFDPEMIDAMEWVAAQPWIDVVSLSLGSPGNVPTPEFDAFAAASRRAAEAGKIIVGATGNSVAPPGADGTNGPQWVIAAGGVTYAQGGESVLAGKAPDVVANFTATVAVHGVTRERFPFAGTSYAAPRVAGVLARSLGEIRKAWGHEGGIAEGALAVSPAGEALTAPSLRAALNASAVYWGAERWDPTQPAFESPYQNALATSAPVVGPAAFAQMGWGYVDNDTAPRIIERILAQDFALPAEKTQAEPYMAAGYASRAAYWDARTRAR